MARSYTLKRRAEQQAQTRRRIVEAAVELHSRLGPAQTTLSMVAERAGVQRHTVYAHFPDDRSLLLACSGLATERDPPPDAAPWRTIQDPIDRLEVGLGAIYAYFERNAELIGSILRDAEVHALTREMIALRHGPPLALIQEVLADGLDATQRPLLALALSFFTWRTLVGEAGLSSSDAARRMARMVAAAGAVEQPPRDGRVRPESDRAEI